MSRVPARIIKELNELGLGGRQVYVPLLKNIKRQTLKDLITEEIRQAGDKVDYERLAKKYRTSYDYVRQIGRRIKKNGQE